jgi:hypothetical protein
MRGGTQVVVKAIAPPDKLREMLEQLPQVKKVAPRDSATDTGTSTALGADTLCEFLVETNSLSPDINTTIAETIVRRGWRLVELYEVGLTLEEIFLRVIASDAAELASSKAESSEQGAKEGLQK